MAIGALPLLPAWVACRRSASSSSSLVAALMVSSAGSLARGSKVKLPSVQPRALTTASSPWPRSPVAWKRWPKRKNSEHCSPPCSSESVPVARSDCIASSNDARLVCVNEPWVCTPSLLTGVGERSIAAVLVVARRPPWSLDRPRIVATQTKPRRARTFQHEMPTPPRVPESGLRWDEHLLARPPAHLLQSWGWGELQAGAGGAVGRPSLGADGRTPPPTVLAGGAGRGRPPPAP